MTQRVRRAAVLGSGVMGSAIAAHLANAGIPSLVLDIVPRELTEAEAKRGLTLADRKVRNRFADHHVNALAKMKPAPLFTAERRKLIETGNFEDDLARISEADWIIEVVKEDLKIKKLVLGNAAPHISETAILSSNTSGLPLHAMAEALPEGLRSRFLGTHFFNPPRYMRLLELIPTRHTAPQVLKTISELASRHLGKGLVTAKDTPNFVANRIGVHAMVATLGVMQESGLSIEELDLLTGPAMGRPKSGTFRLADMVGLDTLALVAGNLFQNAPDDECHAQFEPPAFMKKMIEAGLLGGKTGAGFYKKVKGPERKILVVDLETLEYRDAAKPKLPELKPLARIDDPGKRVAALVSGDGPVGTAAWKILGATLSYSAMRLGEICDHAEAIDGAMRMGFNWELGPFEIWDALGFRPTTDRLRKDGFALPGWIDELYDAGATSLYRRDGAQRTGPTAGEAAPLPVDSRSISIPDLHETGAKLDGNDSASLLDLGDGVLGLEFHSKMNSIDEGTIEMIDRAVERAEAGHEALVLANEGENFCAGANLMLVVEAAQTGNFDAIERIIRSFQAATNRLAASSVPVVAAPHARALGGGCEIALAAQMRQPSAESYIGLVEIGAGLIPAGGGCMRLYKRNLARFSDPYPALVTTFETIGQAKVSSSAEEAKKLGFIDERETWSMNREHVTHDAKALALSAARSGSRPSLPKPLPVLGRSGVALVESALVNMHDGGYISEHDRKIGRELGSILCGGNIPGPTSVSEQHLLDLECESFLRLCGETKSVERMISLLKTGRPLRN